MCIKKKTVNINKLTLKQILNKKTLATCELHQAFSRELLPTNFFLCLLVQFSQFHSLGAW